MEGCDEADDGGFAGAGRADEGGDGPRLRFEIDIVQDGLSGIVGEIDMLEDNAAFDRADGLSSARVFVFRLFAQHFLCAVEPGEGFGDLRADADHLEHGRDQKRHEGCEHHEVAEGKTWWRGENLPRADVHDRRADEAHKHGCGKAHQRDGGETAQHVIEQALDAAGEDASLLGFSVIALDDAHAGQRFGEAAGDFGGDLAALAENGPDSLECLAEAEGRKRR